MKKGVEKSMTKLSLSTSGEVSRFPLRPAKEATKGKKVNLIVNLFKLSLESKIPIKKYHVMVIPPLREPREARDTPSESEKGKPKKSKKDTQPDSPLADTEITKKVPNFIRRKLVDDALKNWAKTCGTKKEDQIKFKYVYDNHATIYTLLDLFANNAKSGENWIETDIEFAEEKIVAKSSQLQMTSTMYKVRIGYKQKQGTVIDLGMLAAYCGGQRLSIEDIQSAIQALNIIINNNLVVSGKFVSIGNNMFSPDKNDFPLGNGLRMSTGFYYSARAVKGGMVLNVANSATAFYEESSLLDLLCKRVATKKRLREGQRIMPKEALEEAQRDKKLLEQFEKDIRQKQIEAQHRVYRGSNGQPHYRKYRVLGLSKGKTARSKFTLVDHVTKKHREVSIQEYFKDVHNTVLKFPDHICIQVGSPGQAVDLPIEVCYLIEKQACRRKLDPKETAEFIKKAATKPDVHFDKICRNAAQIRNSGREVYQQFGISIGAEPLRVQGRELTAAGLKGDKPILPSDGVYRIDKIKFFKPVQVGKWMIAYCTPAYPDRDIPQDKAEAAMNFFVTNYIKSARDLGVQINEPDSKRPITKNDWMAESFWVSKFFGYLENNHIQFVLIILPDMAPDWLYQLIKFGEANSSIRLKKNFIRTQCLKYVNYKKALGMQGRPPDRSLLTNLWLKANEKLGGNNFTLQASTTPGMFDPNNLYIGIDVSHPAPGDALSRSVVAAVGMWNITDKVEYHTILRVQQTRKETSANQVTIEHVEQAADMLEKIAKSYHEKKKKWPNHILILRDGVSEGQFTIVHEIELAKILEATSKLCPKSPIKITYVVVQKRHKIRFRLAERTRNDKDDNIHPGTVVDQNVVHPTDHDFYLAPHKAIQGTSRPAHYYALHDENGYSQDHLQEISHALCYLSPRCTRAISIPAPVYLADLAAERGRNLVIAWASKKTHENVEELNKWFAQLPTEYLNELFYN